MARIAGKMTENKDVKTAAPGAARSEIVVCDTCRQASFVGEAEQTAGEALYEAVRTAHAALAPEERARLLVRRFSCLMNCSRACSAAVAAAEGPEKVAYVLGDFAPGPEAAEALIAYALGHAASESGVVPFRTWPQGVKGKFVARVPPRVPRETE